MDKLPLLRFKFLSCALALGLSSAVAAESFQYQANGLYATTDQGNLDVDVLSIGATAHLKPVNTTGHPFAEAAFLEKSSYASLDYVDITADIGNREKDYDGLAFSGRYVFPDSDFIVEAALETGDLDTVSIGGGVYLDGSTTIIGFFETSDDNAGDIDVLGAKYRLLTNVQAGNTLAVGAHLKYIDAGRDDAIEAGAEADYYVNDFTSVGALLNITQGDFDSVAFGIRGQHFLSPELAIGVSIVRLDPDQGKEADTFSLTGLVRF